MAKQKKYLEDQVRSLDIVCILFVVVLFALTLIFRAKVPQWQSLAKQFFVAGVLFLGSRYIVRLLPEGLFSTILRTARVLALFAFLFQKTAPLQLIIMGRWLDDMFIGWEYMLTGTESSLFLQQFVTPILTEGMMFAYVIYVPLLWGLALICYWSAGARAANDYLFHLALANIICYLGFIALPIASPLFHAPELYTKPLVGGFFTWCGEWIRINVHFPGGSLPSPHCAAGTIMLVMLYRYNRSLFYVALPTFLILYVATVYGRYHYAWDGIAGILSAIGVLKFSPKVTVAVEAVHSWFSRSSVGHAVPQSITE